MKHQFVAVAILVAGAVWLPPMLSAPADAASKVGVASAVRNDVEGVQGAASRPLATGSNIFEQELIRTGAESVAQLLFLDQTTLAVGPRSEVVLDRFVFDPSRNSGDVLLSATRGAFRFISGSQNPLNYKISTPSATIGVRGTIISCAVGSLTCTVEEGGAVIEVAGVSYTLKAGQSLTVDDNGRVTGPYTHDGVLDAVQFGVPWPLYPGALPTEDWTTEIQDDAAVRLEDLFEPELIDDCTCCNDYCDYIETSPDLR